MRDVIDADDTARARPVFGHHSLSQAIAELLRDHAAGEIDDAARLSRAG